MQQARRHNPYPLTWEIPVGIACVVVLTLAVGVHLGNGLTHLTAGQGWVWPQPRDLLTSIPALLSPGSGMTVGDPRPWILAVELLLTGSLVWGAYTLWQRWGPQRLKGMASPEQAERILGVRRLRKAAPIIRPDLHGRNAKQVQR